MDIGFYIGIMLGPTEVAKVPFGLPMILTVAHIMGILSKLTKPTERPCREPWLQDHDKFPALTDAEGWQATL